jgi:hypothetical protein
MLNVKPYSNHVLHAVRCIAQHTSRILFNKSGKYLKKHIRTAAYPFCLFFPHIYFTISPWHQNINY